MAKQKKKKTKNKIDYKDESVKDKVNWESCWYQRVQFEMVKCELVQRQALCREG